MTRREELKKALQEGNLYDFISNEGWRFTNGELVEIIKELDFAIYHFEGEEGCKKYEQEALNNMIEEELFFNEDEED